jgi:hypothetical protein
VEINANTAGALLPEKEFRLKLLLALPPLHAGGHFFVVEVPIVSRETIAPRDLLD